MTVADRLAPVVTIDGPGGSGKGTISRGLAARLGFHFLDSGVLYRLAALSILNRGVEREDPHACAEVAAGMDATFQLHDGDYTVDPPVFLDGQDVRMTLRSEKTGNIASLIAAYGPVREALLARQRAFRQPPGLVADGRDMGTLVFPDAGAKIFLTASAKVRAQRRYKQLIGKGLSVSLPDLVEEIAERDRRDSKRAVAPLRPAPGALVIDSSDMGVVDVLEKALTFALARLPT